MVIIHGNNLGLQYDDINHISLKDAGACTSWAYIDPRTLSCTLPPNSPLAVFKIQVFMTADPSKAIEPDDYFTMAYDPTFSNTPFTPAEVSTIHFLLDPSPNLFMY